MIRHTYSTDKSEVLENFGKDLNEVLSSITVISKVNDEEKPVFDMVTNELGLHQESMDSESYAEAYFLWQNTYTQTSIETYIKMYPTYFPETDFNNKFDQGMNMRDDISICWETLAQYEIMNHWDRMNHRDLIGRSTNKYIAEFYVTIWDKYSKYIPVLKHEGCREKLISLCQEMVAEDMGAFDLEDYLRTFNLIY